MPTQVTTDRTAFCILFWCSNHCGSFNGQEPKLSLYPLFGSLLLRCLPFAIPRFIISNVTKTAKSCAFGSRTHIGQEILESRALQANGNRT